MHTHTHTHTGCMSKRQRKEDGSYVATGEETHFTEDTFVVNVTKGDVDPNNELDWLVNCAPYYTKFSTPETARKVLRTRFLRPTNAIKAMFHRTCTDDDFENYLLALLPEIEDKTTARKLTSDELIARTNKD